MNRKIKFRAWDKKINEWKYFELGHLIAGTARFYDGVVGTGLDNWFEFTGLKDKNEFDIYEGDIVIFLGEKKYEVKFENGAFCVNIGYELFDWGEDCEVIGNIYENKNLLK